jgi:hypothetical protein
MPSSCTADHCDGDCNTFLVGSSTCYCDLSANDDLTGSEITSDQNVAVFAGHNCTFTPYYYWACDHLEEQLFPVATWGKRYVAAPTNEPGNHPDIYRVMAGADGTTVSLVPAVAGPFTLAKGQWAEFTTTSAFEATGTQPFLVAQFMVGQNYGDNSSSNGSGAGDPSMALAVPVEQYRTSYVFLAPESYVQNYVTVVAPVGSAVTLDGTGVTGFAAVGAGAYAATTVAIPSGSHTITGAAPFGITVFGIAPYTSYMYPGGLDLKSQP